MGNPYEAFAQLYNVLAEGREEHFPPLITSLEVLSALPIHLQIQAAEDLITAASTLSAMSCSFSELAEEMPFPLAAEEDMDDDEFEDLVNADPSLRHAQ